MRTSFFGDRSCAATGVVDRDRRRVVESANTPRVSVDEKLFFERFDREITPR
jgi:hypothetical protein